MTEDQDPPHIKTMSAEEAAMLGLPLSFPSRLVGWRIDHAAVIAYPQLADGTEGEPFDLVPLIAWMQRERGKLR